MTKLLKSDKVPGFGRYEQIEMQIADLLQSRQMRVESERFHKTSKIIWGVMLLPQTILLVIFAAQFSLLKLRERRLKKRTAKMTRERDMVQGLLQEMRNQHSVQVERPAPIELL